mmetsp:Transcript_1718/g.5843  ORF Transcript_1718/g.5843 Transcript_1718/m.5843 type:complete len:219 (-) Transcript_1718:700-1356(-)
MQHHQRSALGPPLLALLEHCLHLREGEDPLLGLPEEPDVRAIDDDVERPVPLYVAHEAHEGLPLSLPLQRQALDLLRQSHQLAVLQIQLVQRLARHRAHPVRVDLGPLDLVLSRLTLLKHQVPGIEVFLNDDGEVFLNLGDLPQHALEDIAPIRLILRPGRRAQHGLVLWRRECQLQSVHHALHLHRHVHVVRPAEAQQGRRICPQPRLVLRVGGGKL